jgi:hypothetical protein
MLIILFSSLLSIIQILFQITAIGPFFETLFSFFSYFFKVWLLPVDELYGLQLGNFFQYWDPNTPNYREAW